MNIYYWILGDVEDSSLYHYCGGIYMVAAESEEQAKEFALTDDPCLFNSSYPQCNIDLIYKIDKATIDIEEPKCLIAEGYAG